MSRGGIAFLIGTICILIFFGVSRATVRLTSPHSPVGDSQDYGSSPLGPADLILTNAQIYTLDECEPLATTVFIRAGLIAGLMYSPSHVVCVSSGPEAIQVREQAHKPQNCAG